jgi:hypothetical protein
MEKEKGKKPRNPSNPPKTGTQKAKRTTQKNQENHKTVKKNGNSPQVAEWSLRRNEWMGPALDQKSGSSREKTGVVRAEES